MSERNQDTKRSSDPRRTRRGATLVLMAIVITVLVMFAGLGIDFGRMWTFNGQLKVLTDAASHSGAIDLGKGDTVPATARALALKASNQVDGVQTADMVDADIEPGVWNFTDREFTPNAGRAWSGANAVKATARYNANWLLGRIFTGGGANRMLTQNSVAALGSQVSSSCLKPFAIPYGALLAAVGKSGQPLNYTLQQEDIAMLSSSTGVPVEWDMYIGSSGNENLVANTPSGSFAMVGFEPLISQLSNNAYLDSIIPPGCTAANVGVGDTVQAITGVTQGNVLPPLAQLCPGRPNNGTQFWSCTNPVSVQVPIYNDSYATGNNGRYVINYIAAFKLTGVDFRSNTNRISGYLSIAPAASGGGFSPFPGPVTMAVIVK